jgi:hypothetical protein
MAEEKEREMEGGVYIKFKWPGDLFLPLGLRIL